MSIAVGISSVGRIRNGFDLRRLSFVIREKNQQVTRGLNY